MASYYIFGDISFIACQILRAQKIKVKSNPSLSWAWPSSVPTCLDLYLLHYDEKLIMTVLKKIITKKLMNNFEIIKRIRFNQLLLAKTSFVNSWHWWSCLLQPVLHLVNTCSISFHTAFHSSIPGQWQAIKTEISSLFSTWYSSPNLLVQDC